MIAPLAQRPGLRVPRWQHINSAWDLLTTGLDAHSVGSGWLGPSKYGTPFAELGSSEALLPRRSRVSLRAVWLCYYITLVLVL